MKTHYTFVYIQQWYEKSTAVISLHHHKEQSPFTKVSKSCLPLLRAHSLGYDWLSHITFNIVLGNSFFRLWRVIGGFWGSVQTQRQNEEKPGKYTSSYHQQEQVPRHGVTVVHPAGKATVALLSPHNTRFVQQTAVQYWTGNGTWWWRKASYLKTKNHE